MDEQKKCYNQCPKCGIDEPIEWQPKDYQDSIIYQQATCLICGCEFTEIYEYHHTDILEQTERNE